MAVMTEMYKVFSWIPMDWRWWKRFSGKFHARYLKRLIKIARSQRKEKPKLNLKERFGTPRKEKEFGRMRLSKKFSKNRFHFTDVIC